VLRTSYCYISVRGVSPQRRHHFLSPGDLMSKKLVPAALMIAFLLVSSSFAQSPSALSLEDQIRAGNALVA
jgi:hypothetical protein